MSTPIHDAVAVLRQSRHAIHCAVPILPDVSFESFDSPDDPNGAHTTCNALVVSTLPDPTPEASDADSQNVKRLLGCVDGIQRAWGFRVEMVGCSVVREGGGGGGEAPRRPRGLSTVVEASTSFRKNKRASSIALFSEVLAQGGESSCALDALISSQEDTALQVMSDVLDGGGGGGGGVCHFVLFSRENEYVLCVTSDMGFRGNLKGVVFGEKGVQMDVDVAEHADQISAEIAKSVVLEGKGVTSIGGRGDAVNGGGIVAGQIASYAANLLKYNHTTPTTHCCYITETLDHEFATQTELSDTNTIHKVCASSFLLQEDVRLAELYLTLLKEESATDAETKYAATEQSVLEEYGGMAATLKAMSAELDRKNVLLSEQAAHLEKHDSALALFQQHMRSTTDRELLLEEVSTKQAKIDSLNASAEKQAIHTAELTAQLAALEESCAIERRGQRQNISEMQVDAAIKRDVHQEVESALHAAVTDAAERTRAWEKSKLEHIERCRHLSTEVASSRDAALLERQKRISAEQQFRELQLKHDAHSARSKAALHSAQLNVSYEGQRALSKIVQLEQERDAAERSLAEERQKTETLTRSQIERRIQQAKEVDVQVFALQQNIADLKQESVEVKEELETMRSERNAKARCLSETQDQLSTMEQQYLAEAVKYNASKSSLDVSVTMLEKEVEEGNRVNKSKTRLLQDTIKDHTLRLQKLSAQHRDEVSLLQTSIETITKREADQCVEVQRLLRLQEETELALEEARRDHTDTRTELSAAKKEIANLEKVSTAIKDNFHFRILQDQLERKSADITYLQNRIRGLESNIQGMEVDRVLSSESRSLGEGTLRNRLELAEVSRGGVEKTLRGVLEVLGEPVNQQTFDASAPLLHYMPSALQRDLAVLANTDASQHICEPNWVAPEGVVQQQQAAKPKLLSPLPVTKEPLGTFTGLPTAIPGTVDSCLYLTHQRSKMTPSIYDVDW